MPRRRNEPIATWEAGDTVEGFALVSKKEQRSDRNNRTYLDMELADASGAMPAKVWADSPALEGDYETHDFVAFRGAVKLYRDALQISIDDCRRVTDEDRRFGFDEAKLIPSTLEDIGELWDRLERLLDEEVEHPMLRRLARRALDTHGPALKEHPAAKSIHHAYRGGLLEHVVSMAELALAVCRHYPELDRGLVLVGVLFHDLGKIYELGAMPANDYTLPGRLVGHVVMGRDMLLECCAAVPDFPDDLRLHLEHLVLSHQGRKEFSAPVEPMTAEALVLHFVDDLDSKVNQLRIQARSARGLQFIRGLGRYVFLGRLGGEDGSSAPREAPKGNGREEASEPASDGEDPQASPEAAVAQDAAALEAPPRSSGSEQPEPLPEPPQGSLFES